VVVVVVVVAVAVAVASGLATFDQSRVVFFILFAVVAFTFSQSDTFHSGLCPVNSAYCQSLG